MVLTFLIVYNNISKSMDVFKEMYVLPPSSACSDVASNVFVTDSPTEILSWAKLKFRLYVCVIVGYLIIVLNK